MRKKAAAIASMLALTGCVGPLIHDHVRVDAASPQATESVKVYTQEELKGRRFSLMQPITAVSCMNKVWDPVPSKDEAVTALKIKATRVLANGITNLYCEDLRGTSLGNNCWSYVTCHGAAIRVEP